MTQIRKTMSLRIFITVFLGVCILTFASSPAYAVAGIYRTINFQGKVVNKTDGTNISNASYSFTFKLYDAASGGTQLPSGTPWSETQSLSVTDGIFRATLGSSTSIPSTLDFNSDALYLDITFNGETFASRVRLTSVPYAFNAEKVGGLTVTNTTGTLTIPNGTTIAFSGANNLTFTTSAFTNATLPSGTVTLVDLAAGQVLTNKTIGSTGLVFNGATTDVTTVSNEDFIISPNGTGKVGIGNASPTAKLDVTGTASISGVFTIGNGVTNSIQSPYGPLTFNYKSGLNTWATGLTLQDSTGYIGLGTTAPQAQLHILNAGTVVQPVSGSVLAIQSSNTAGSQAFLNILGGTSGSAGIYLGGASIGTRSKGGISYDVSLDTLYLRSGDSNRFSLDTNGNASTSGNLSLGNGSALQSAYGPLTLNYKSGLNTWTAGLTLQDSTGYVGLGVTSPTTRLDVSQLATASTAEEIAHFAISDDATAYMSVRNGSSTDSLFSPQLRFKGSGANTAGNIQGLITTDTGTQPAWIFTSQLASSMIAVRPLMAIRNYTTDVVNILANGNLGINNTSPAEKLDVGGNATMAGNLSIGGQLQVGRFGSEPTQLGLGSMYYNSTSNKFRCYQNSAWTDCIGAGGTPSWDTVSAPGANLSLAMSTWTSTFTYGAATSTNNLFNLTDTNSNTGTGYMMNLTTGTSSTLKPFHVAAAGVEGILVNASGNVGIGNTTPNAKLDVAGTASVSGNITMGNGSALQSAYGPLTLNYKSGLNSWTAGLVVDDITGNVGIGNSTATSNPLEKLHVGGNILIDAKPNTTTLQDTTWTAISNSAGNISGGTGSIASISAMVNYNGSLYVGTEKANGAEVYRYNGSTLNTWTVMNNTPGTFLTTASIDRVSSMIVYNGKMYIGTFESGNAEIYRFDGVNTWVRVVAAAGQVLTTTGIDGIGSMVVYSGKLYAGTIEAGKAEIYRYLPQTSITTWEKVSNATAGTIITTTAMDAIYSMVVYNNSLIAAGSKPNSAEIYRYSGGTIWTRNGTAGTLVTAARDYITSMVVYNGRLYIGVTEPGGGADVIRLDDNMSDTAWTATYVRANVASGQMKAGGTSAITGISNMAVYNGRMYIGTNKVGAAEIYRYDGDLFTKISQEIPGKIAINGTMAVDEISSMLQYDDDFIIGTKKATGAEVYKNTSVMDESYALIFHGSNSNMAEQNNQANDAEIMFSASASAAMNNNASTTGNFVFSHGIKTAFGAYDVAEDYPTRDQLVQPGDIVSLDGDETGMVNRSQTTYDKKMVGVYSENPGLRLSQKVGTTNGGEPIPVALVGRVPVRVTTENGEIAVGDSLTSSSIPGVAMKATKAGMVLGRAMEGYGGDGVGKILTFVNMSSFNGVAQKTYAAATSLETGEGTVDSNSTLSEIVTDKVTTGLVLADRISANHIDGLDEVKDTISALNVKLSSLEANLSLRGSTASADIINSNSIPSSTGLTLLGNTTAYKLNIIDRLTLGLLEIESDASASGSIQTAVVPLQLQKDALGNLEIMGSRVVIDMYGNMLVRESITAGELKTNKVTILDGKDATSGAVLSSSAGRSEIAAGQTAVRIKTSILTDKSLIFSTPENVPTGVAARKVDDSTIEISIASPLSEILKVNWWIIN